MKKAKVKVDLSGVEFPKVKARAKEMWVKIRKLITEGYTKLLTRTVICLNCEDGPGPDEPIEGYKIVGFWHNCHKRKVESGVYNDILLYAGK